jgi:hypothetical protein
MYQELENGDVQITMSRNDWGNLLLALGYAAASAHEREDLTSRSIFGIINRLNEGNPRFRPYDLGPEATLQPEARKR